MLLHCLPVVNYLRYQIDLKCVCFIFLAFRTNLHNNRSTHVWAFGELHFDWERLYLQFQTGSKWLPHLSMQNQWVCKIWCHIPLYPAVGEDVSMLFFLFVMLIGCCVTAHMLSICSSLKDRLIISDIACLKCVWRKN